MSKIKLVTAIPGPESERLHRMRQATVARGVSSTFPIYIKESHGSILIDEDGNHLIDMGCGIGVTTLGHSHPAVVDAARAQINSVWHTLFSITPYESYVEVCKLLAKNTPGDFPKKSLLLNSGAEAVENAVKISRAYTGRPTVAVLDRSFHGRTNLTSSMTYRGSLYSSDFGPTASNIVSAPNSYPLHDRLSGKEAAARTISYLETRVAARNIACLFYEPIQGEGGVIVPADGFLPALQDWCRENDIVFVADEIQSGFGRTGCFFASETDGLEPDIVCSAKGIANGLPLSAVTGRSDIVDAARPGTLGGTFTGNHVSCAAALEVFEQYKDNAPLDSASRLGDILKELLLNLQSKHPQIAEVRGRGAMFGAEFSGNHAGEMVSRVITRAAELGVIFLSSGVEGNVVRFLPNIFMDKETIEEAIGVLDSAISSVV